jgi:hypothetical protein
VDDADDAPADLRRAPAERAARAMLPACGGVWTAAEIMHLAGVPWLDITLGTAAAAAIGYGNVRHRAEGRSAEMRARARRHARHVAGGIMVTGAWAAAAARLGPLAGPHCALTLTWAGISLAGWLWVRRHEVVTEARDWRNARADWLGTRRRWRLDRTFLLHREQTRLGEKLILDVSGSGKLASDIAASNAAGWIAQDRKIARTRVSIAVHGHEGQVSVDIRERDPWKHPIAHPLLDPSPEIDLSGPCTCREPFVIGQDPETGAPLTLTVYDEDGGKRILVVATSRAGKTVLLSNLRERATKARDVLVVDLNLSKALEDKEWSPACHLTALTRHQSARAMRILRVLNAVIEWRSQQPRETAVFQPSPGQPLILFIGDEIDALSRYQGARELLKDIFSKGGSEGVTPVVSGQRGTAEWLGGGDVRALVDVFCIGMVQRRGEAMHAAGDLGLEMPDMSKYGEGRKGVWAIAELGGDIRTGRTFLLKEPADLRKFAGERAHSQPELEPELKAFLGDSYANLLSTDAYARWAHEQDGPAPAAAAPRPDAAPQDTPAAAGPESGTVATATVLDTYDREAEDFLDDDMRTRLRKMGERNDETRRTIAETAAAPAPDISREDQFAHARARWDQEAEGTEIPPDMREKLLGLVAGEGISARRAVDALGIPEASRAKVTWWLNRLRWEGSVTLEGKGRAAKWKLVPPPDGGDVP